MAIICTLLFLPSILSAQDEAIPLRNPSFEDDPHIGKLDLYRNPVTEIRGWVDCGARGESPPDIHPSGGFRDSTEMNGWEVARNAQEGYTFLGMVVRDNSTNEAISQPLAKPLNKEQCYAFSVYLAQSSEYLSASRSTGNTAQFTRPAVFRIWGGYGPCDKKELLGESPPVDHRDWRRYELKLEPRGNYSWIRIEAYYKVPVFLPYNGHILVDDASDLQPIPCDIPEEELPVAFEQNEPEGETPTRINASPKKPTTQSTPPQTDIAQEEKNSGPVSNENAGSPPRKRIIKELDGQITRGQVIRLNRLYFAADSATIKPGSFEVLEELYIFLKDHPEVKVEIGGHTNTIPDPSFADYLSLERAKAVADYLEGRGIPSDRLTTKGYGKNRPIIANDKLSKMAQQKNQRVEIKILTLEGER